MWLGVPFEIQLKEATRHNLRKNTFLAEFQTELFRLKICFDLYHLKYKIFKSLQGNFHLFLFLSFL